MYSQGNVVLFISGLLKLNQMQYSTILIPLFLFQNHDYSTDQISGEMKLEERCV